LQGTQKKAKFLEIKRFKVLNSFEMERIIVTGNIK